MISDEIFERCVQRAALAPTVHNTQPARWARDGGALTLFCDTNVGLPVADPTGRDAALSCGAVLEAMVLALSAEGIAARADLANSDLAPGRGLVPVAHLTLSDGPEDGLHHQLERRFTWRGGFETKAPDLFGWTRADTRFVLDQAGRDFLAERNDWASHEFLNNQAFRAELVSWMRLRDTHPRAGQDGMDRQALRLSKGEARMSGLALGPFWRILKAAGLTRRMISEADITSRTPVIALFHREKNENTVTSGRAYLRLCLEAASLGFAGWPMAGLTDHPTTHAALCERFGIAPDRRLIQVLRFGVPTGAPPSRARRPLNEVLR